MNCQNVEYKTTVDMYNYFDVIGKSKGREKILTYVINKSQICNQKGTFSASVDMSWLSQNQMFLPDSKNSHKCVVSISICFWKKLEEVSVIFNFSS